MPTFPLFPSLPIELQRQIWQSILDEAPEPIVQICSIDDIRRGGPFSAKVFLNPSVLMHVCHLSREMARKQLKFNRIVQGACLEPYRDVDPDTDAIFIEYALDSCWSDVLRDHWRVEAARIRHLALECGEMGYFSGVAGFAWNMTIFSGLRKVSLVCSDRRWELREYDLAERVRYRLLDYPETERTKLGVATDPWNLARSFQERAIHAFVSRPSRARLADCDSATAPYDESTGEFLFDVVPSKMEATRESIPKDLARNALLWPDSGGHGGLHDLLRDILL